MRVTALILVVLAVGCRDTSEPVPIYDPALTAKPQAVGSTPKKSSGVTVEGTRLTFEPATCTEGEGHFAWGLGSVTVTVLRHEHGMCVFDYQWEVEGAGNYAVHRVRVPTDSGPVVIEAEGNKGETENHWSYVFTSFTAKQAKLVRRRLFGWDEVPVGRTGDFAAYQIFRPGNHEPPIERGDKVTLRFLIYLDVDFTKRADREWRRSVTVVIGEDDEWEWVQAVSLGMTPNEIRRIRVPARIRGPARDWLGGDQENSTIFAEMQLIAVERK